METRVNKTFKIGMGFIGVAFLGVLFIMFILSSSLREPIGNLFNGGVMGFILLLTPLFIIAGIVLLFYWAAVTARQHH
jgi:hypothetical protein